MPIDERERLIHEPALHLRRTGDKTDVVVTENNARDIGNYLLPIGDRFAVQLNSFLPSGLFDDNSVCFVPAMKNGLHRQITFAMPYECVVSSCPKRRAVTSEIDGLEEVGLALSILANQKHISRVRFNGRIVKIAKMIETNTRKGHVQSSCIGITM